MKRILFTGFLVVFSTLLFAQQWETDFATAKAKAEQQGKNIVLNFCGSDWCIPCIKLEKTIWDSFEFKDYAKSHYILLRADFPKKKADALSKEQQEKNDRLAELYNKQGLFPLVVILDKKGKVLGTTGFKNVPPHEYIALLHSLETNSH